VNTANFVLLLCTDLISLVNNVRISVEILSGRCSSHLNVQVTTKDTNVRSLRFRFKTFELDCESRRESLLYPPAIWNFRKTISRPTLYSHRRLSFLAAAFEELFPNVCSYYCSASCRDRFRFIHKPVSCMSNNNQLLCTPKYLERNNFIVHPLVSCPKTQ